MGRLAIHYISAMKTRLTPDLYASAVAMHTIHLHRYLTATVYAMENAALPSLCR